MKPFIE